MRPREKLLNHGASALTDTELLALFLRTGIKGMHIRQALSQGRIQRVNPLTCQ
ncbi:MAG: UPF0758 domain-containing protein [Rhodoluna sp.]